ncbi:MAG: family 43 glycosylhydrolase [Terracidiphilus sp.]|nr:family 43 glycosylhydrolase [Terracidiphilus sp.]
MGLAPLLTPTARHCRDAAVILRGEFPDPTVLRDGSDFYMTHSNDDVFAPTLLLWHSTDLYHWTPVGPALENFSFAIAAPEMVKHKNTYYIYFPARRSIFVMTAQHPEGPWSEPCDMKVPGFDPGHVVTPDGKRYLYFSGGRVVPLSDDGLSVTGKIFSTYNGWKFPNDWNVECFCLESPKFTFHDGYYYMTSAEGGTTGPSTSHMAVSARSRSPLGPWENSPYNPIVHTGSAREAWWSKGHGTLIDDGKGHWYIVYHAYENDHRELGRQTLIEPVEWDKAGWFHSSAPSGVDFHPKIIDNYTVHSDDFCKPTLGLQWSFGGNPFPLQYVLESGSVKVKGSAGGLATMHCRPSDPDYEAVFRLEGTNEAEIGILLLYRSDNALCAGIGKKGDRVFSLRRGSPTSGIAGTENVRYFRIRVKDHDLAVSYSSDGIHWKYHPEGSSIYGYDESVLGGYASLKIAAYIKGEGRLTIQDFKYHPLNSSGNDVV